MRGQLDENRVWPNHRPMLGDALQSRHPAQRRQAVQLLARTEITLKQEYGQSVWADLEGLSPLPCDKALADVFRHGLSEIVTAFIRLHL